MLAERMSVPGAFPLLGSLPSGTFSDTRNLPAPLICAAVALIAFPYVTLLSKILC